jgi:hypothetical protein
MVIHPLCKLSKLFLQSVAQGGVLISLKHSSLRATMGGAVFGEEDFLYVRYEVSTAVTVKNAVFSDVRSYGSCNNRRFGGTYRLHQQNGYNRRTRENVSSD